ncbi:hypothetical protein [Parasphingorhabdus sp.]|uniref:hypothetical protein n=1 Tax=Parasphingorhabdus sp. TaxID=2709688 RepID=UPI003D2CAAD1
MGGTLSELAQSLTATARISDMPTGQKSVIMAMRVAILARIEKQSPKPYLTRQFGDEVTAGHFAHIIELMGDCWPEPMVVHRPCCSSVTYDEMLLLDLVTATVQNEPQHFDGLLSEMIGRSDRQKLGLVFAKFVNHFAYERKMR